ncbi:unnamed protein product [Parnassius apollo]|uniref:(apollo) hypothetical protein n=1 Tax=Parnassius apollo TaxID=110799 RepID=A0A8S3YA16_PARAO|nr:unnamed protein product [Parnassius apollo]
MSLLIKDTDKEFVLRVRKLVTNTKNNSEVINSDIAINTKEVDETHSTVVESEKLVGGYTTDAIVHCAFGFKSSVMDNPKDPFVVALQAFYEMTLYNIYEK